MLDKIRDHNMKLDGEFATLLTNIDEYAINLSEYESQVFIRHEDGWSRKYLDYSDVFITTPSTGQKDGLTLYQFKKEYDSEEKRQLALTELSGYVKTFNKGLKGNKALGDNKPNSIPVNIFFSLHAVLKK